MMLAHNVHPSVNLDYNYAIYEQRSPTQPKDLQMGKNLRITDDPAPMPPLTLSEPISKTFSNIENANPLKHLIESRIALLDSFKMKLPYSSDKKEAETKPQRKTQPKKTIKKRILQDSDSEGDHSYYDESSIYCTPIPNKTIFFSPSFKKPTESTPKKSTKETEKSNRGPTTKTETLGDAAVLKRKEKDANDSDALACHANNIMRMAVDSTMIGSSFSLSFSSTFANDSVLGSKRRVPEDDADHSLLEGLKQRRSRASLAKSAAKSVEINAADLQAAVCDL